MGRANPEGRQDRPAGVRIVGVLLALFLALAGRPAAADPASLWQTLLEGAAAAIEDNDDETAAVLLHAAQHQAIVEDPKGIRVTLTALQLGCVYLLLGNDKASRQVSGAMPDLKAAVLDATLPAEADSFGRLADAYHARWRAMKVPEATPQRQALIATAALLYSLRSILFKVQGKDMLALAGARSDEGRAHYEKGDDEGAIEALSDAVRLWNELETRHAVLRAASRELTPLAEGKFAMPSDLETEVGGVPAFTTKQVLALAYRRRARREEATRPELALADYDAAIARVELDLQQYADVLVGQAALASSYYYLAVFCRDERAFRSARNDRNLDALIDKGRHAYAATLDLLVQLEGAKARDVVAVAEDFAKFLRDSGDKKGAADVEAHYLVPSSQ